MIKYIDIQRLGSEENIKLGLDNISKLCSAMKNPQKKYFVVHVAGTNGKGSTCAMLSSILSEAGYKVGLYTSPHLVKFNERIKINGKNISDKELRQEISVVKRFVVNKKIPTTFFEFTTALAFNYFARKKIDIAIIEVGLGGRFDATNIVSPGLSIITSIDFDHTQILGNSLKKIAFEKAGIIKNCPVIVNETKKSALDIIKKKCSDSGAPLIQVKDFIKLTSSTESIDIQKFFVKSCYNGQFAITLNGAYQIDNALTALVATHFLNDFGFKISNNSIRVGLKKTNWPARLQFVSKKPFIVVDGSHNFSGMKKSVLFFKKLKNRKVLLIGFSKDKHLEKILEQIVPLFKEIVITQSNFKPMSTEKIFGVVKKFKKKVSVFENSEIAFEYALNKLDSEKDSLVITGSLYLAGNILSVINKKNPSKKIIVAMTKKRVIGLNGRIPWTISEEKKFFKQVTLESTVIMGRKTFEEIGKPLPQRNNIVLSKSLKKIRGAIVFDSFEKAISYANSLGKTIFFIGGEKIYSQAIPFCDEIIVSVVNVSSKGNSYFPRLGDEWKVFSKKSFSKFNIVKYKRKFSPKVHAKTI